MGGLHQRKEQRTHYSMALGEVQQQSAVGSMACRFWEMNPTGDQ